MGRASTYREKKLCERFTALCLRLFFLLCLRQGSNQNAGPPWWWREVFEAQRYPTSPCAYPLWASGGAATEGRYDSIVCFLSWFSRYQWEEEPQTKNILALSIPRRNLFTLLWLSQYVNCPFLPQACFVLSSFKGKYVASQSSWPPLSIQKSISIPSWHRDRGKNGALFFANEFFSFWRSLDFKRAPWGGGW